ncbi:MAG: ABC transporter permease [Bryobacteraceae bacterium]
MSAGYLDIETHAEGANVALRFRLENRSEKRWSPADHVCLGWQIYDPHTARFISEGDWLALEQDLAPGATRDYALQIPLPVEPGRYHLYVSPRSEAEGWFFDQQWPFLLVEAAVGQAGAHVDRAEVTTLGRVHRHHWPRKLVAAFTEPFATAWQNRRLIGSLVRREITARYRGSLGDVAWTILHPLLLMLTYFFVFGVVMQARFGNDPSHAGFVLYFLAGMLCWLPFSEAVGRAPGVVAEHRVFVKKLVFPIETLPVSQAMAGLVTEGFALLIFLGLLVASRGAIPVTALWLPVIVAPQLLLTIGLGWGLAAIGVFLRDLGQSIGFLLTLVFFLTPICYPESQLPAWAAAPLRLSPIYALVANYRRVLLENQTPAWTSLAGVWLIALLVFLAGYACFRKFRKAFADVL